MRATDLAQLLLSQVLKLGDWAVDATVGNGHDTVWLAQQVGPQGRVFGFDIQDAAIASAAVRVGGLPQVTLLPCGHEQLTARLPLEANGCVKAVMFNLGYLPGCARDTITRADTTLAALTQALDILAVGGAVTLIVYPGHPGGADEAACVRRFAESLPTSFAVSSHARLNARRPAPELIVIAR